MTLEYAINQSEKGEAAFYFMTMLNKLLFLAWIAFAKLDRLLSGACISFYLSC